MAIEFDHKQHQGLRVVHPTWTPGYPAYGTVVRVPNRWHVDINTTAFGEIRVHQASLVWAQDWKGGR